MINEIGNTILIRSTKNLRKKKATGGHTSRFRGRRAFEKNRYSNETVLGEIELVQRKVLGNSRKKGLRKVNYVNVTESSTQKTFKIKILKVLKNPANRDYERRGVITKGCIIETEKGNVKVTSRPGQIGIVNGILLK